MYHQFQVHAMFSYVSLLKDVNHFPTAPPIGLKCKLRRKLQGEPDRQRTIEWIQAARAAQKQYLGGLGFGLS